MSPLTAHTQGLVALNLETAETTTALQTGGECFVANLVDAPERGRSIVSAAIRPSTSDDHALQVTTPDDAPRVEDTKERTSYLGETGFLHMFSNDSGILEPNYHSQYNNPSPSVTITPSLMEMYVNTYFDYCYTFCPVVDWHHLEGENSLLESQLFRHSVAAIGSWIQPPLVQHDARGHYRHAKSLFYQNADCNPSRQITSIMLFWWLSTVPPNQVSMDSRKLIASLLYAPLPALYCIVNPPRTRLVVEWCHYKTSTADWASSRVTTQSSWEIRSGAECSSANMVDSLCE